MAFVQQDGHQCAGLLAEQQHQSVARWQPQLWIAVEAGGEAGLSAGLDVGGAADYDLRDGDPAEEPGHQVAYALRGKRGVLVITNNINVVNILRGAPDMEVIVAGGVVRPTDGGVVGEVTVDFIRQFKMDYAIIGVSAIDEDGSLLDFDYREVKVAQAIIENARHTILVADSTKYERSAPVRIGHISQLSDFVTDQPLPASLAAICAENDVQVLIADED